MEFLKKHKNLTVIAVILLSYYIFSVLMIPLAYLLLFYLFLIILVCVVFKAGLMSILANLAYSRDKKEASKRFFERSFKYNTKSPATHLNYAIMLLHEGDADRSLALARKGLELKPDILTEKNLRLTIGSSLWMKGNIEEAAEALEAMLKDFDYVNSHVLTTLGYLYLVQGKLDLAKEITEKAIEDKPDSGPAWDNMGQIYFKEDNLDKAVEAFKSAIRHRDNLVDSQYFLGLIYEKQGNKDEARDCFIKAYGCKISSLNTVTKDEVLAKYNEYSNYYTEED